MKSKIILSLLIVMFPAFVLAQAFYFPKADGLWNDPDTWDGSQGDPDDDADGIPDANDNVFITDGFTVSCNSSVSALTLDFLMINALDLPATLEIESGGVLNVVETLTLKDEGDPVTYPLAIGILNINASNAVINIGLNLDFNASADGRAILNFNAAGTINIEGSIISSRGSITVDNAATGATIVVKSTQTLPFNSTFITYPNVTFNSSGTLTLGNNITATNFKGNITIENGTLANGGFSITGNSGKTFTLNNTSTFTLTGAGGFPTGFSTYTLANTSTVNYNGSNSAIAAADYGNLTIAGTGAKTLSGTASVYGDLTVTGVTFNAGSGQLTMTSDASHHARIAESTGTISGTVNMQRYVATSGYTILSSPTTSATVSDFNDDINIYNMTGATPGGGNSNWFTYNESDATWPSPTNVTDGFSAGDGQLVYIENAPLTLDITGTPNINASTTIPLSRSGDGYHLAGNPFNSDVQFNTSNGNTSTNGHRINSAKNGYTSITSGIDNIGAWEGIWIEATANPGEIQFTEANKRSGNVFNSRQGNEYNPYAIDMLYIHLYEGLMHRDRLSVKSAEDATDNFESRFDLVKFNNDPGIANIAGIVDGNVVSVNSWAANGSLKTLPIRVFTDYPSNSTKSYSLVFENLNSLTQNNACYLLEDLVTGNTYHLTSDNDTIYFTQSDAVTANRFVLHYSKPIEAEGTNLTCYNSNDGKIVASGTGAGPFNYTWKDNAGTVIQTSTAVAGSDSLTNLAANSYTVTIANNANCPFVSTTIALDEPNQIIAAATLDKDSANILLNEGITVTNTSVNAADFTIAMGDGNSYTNQSPITHYYTVPGSYTITVTASTNGAECSNSSTYAVEVINTTSVSENTSEADAKLWLDPKSINLELNTSWNNESLTITATNELGQVISSSNATYSGSILTIDKPKTAGLYVIKVESVTKTYLRKIVIE